jgi:hypothetical protein
MEHKISWNPQEKSTIVHRINQIIFAMVKGILLHHHVIHYVQVGSKCAENVKDMVPWVPWVGSRNAWNPPKIIPFHTCKDNIMYTTTQTPTYFARGVTVR